MTQIISQSVITAAQASQKAWKIPASVTIAQWALESGWGASVTGKNNYGGVKAKTTGGVFPFKPGVNTEPATLCWTKEVYNGQKVRCQQWFKDYDTPDAFFDAHGKLLATGAPYAAARKKLPDPYAFADALTGVYATDPNYGTTLKSIIRSNNLTRFDNV